MDTLTSAAASGFRSRQEALDMLANNLANSQTNGFKVDREFYSLYASAAAEDPNAWEPVTMPVIQKNWTDFSQGNLHVTANPTDFGISGDGFFAVAGPSGNLYTRNGSFHLDGQAQLVTGDGYPVLGSDGKPLQIDPRIPFEVTARGEITQAGGTVGQMQLASFQSTDLLSKFGATYFSFAGQAGDVQQATGEIHQGAVEDANVNSAESSVRLVNLMRQFDMLQKAVSIASDMSKQAVEQIAKSGS